MGMYDTIIFNCPDCGEEINAQSKSGYCNLKTYPFNCVPSDVAVDANRHAPFICVCGNRFKFAKPTVVALTIQRVR